jgi:hypothetical protein
MLSFIESNMERARSFHEKSRTTLDGSILASATASAITSDFYLLHICSM